MDRFVAQAASALGSTGHPVAARLVSRLSPLQMPSIAPASRSLPALEHLNPALAAHDAHALAGAIAEHRDALPWQEVDPALIPTSYAGRHAFCEIVGPDGIAVAESLRMGLYLQSPDTFYPAHSHDAEELYLVVSGTALWQAGAGDFLPLAPGSLIHHRPGEAHATHTKSDPLLALWGWLGDIGFDSYRLEG